MCRRSVSMVVGDEEEEENRIDLALVRLDLCARMLVCDREEPGLCCCALVEGLLWGGPAVARWILGRVGRERVPVKGKPPPPSLLLHVKTSREWAPRSLFFFFSRLPCDLLSLGVARWKKSFFFLFFWLYVDEEEGTLTGKGGRGSFALWKWRKRGMYVKVWLPGCCAKGCSRPGCCAIAREKLQWKPSVVRFLHRKQKLQAGTGSS